MIVEFALPLVKARAASVLLAFGTVTVKAEIAPMSAAPPVNVPVSATAASVPAEMVASVLSVGKGVGVGFGAGVGAGGLRKSSTACWTAADTVGSPPEFMVLQTILETSAFADTP